MSCEGCKKEWHRMMFYKGVELCEHCYQDQKIEERREKGTPTIKWWG